MSDCSQEWRDFFKANCNALFQTALLLTADANAAEAALVKSIGELDISASPTHSSLTALEEIIVARSIELAPLSSPDLTTGSLLQPGLRPVIEIDLLPRICFVLRTLLGYTTASCTQLLGIEENRIRVLLATAVIQLQQNVTTSRIRS